MEMALNTKTHLRLLTSTGCSQNAGPGACPLRGGRGESGAGHGSLPNGPVLEKKTAIPDLDAEHAAVYVEGHARAHTAATARA